MYYNNIRGVKSKINTLEEIIKDVNPHIICLTEAHLGKDENIIVDNYTFIHNNNKEGKGGVSIWLRNDIKHMCIEISRETKEYETLWIKISNNKNINIRIGNIYAPQECRTKEKVILNMYNHISKQKTETEKLDEKIIVVGDFNCKIGNKINNNKDEISKYGKIFLKMVEEQEFAILNTHNKCDGKWTRIENGKKSVIDYVLTSNNDKEHLNKMIIDENKLYTPYHVIKNRTIYSDHCAIIVKMDWHVASRIEEEKFVTVINKKSLEMFKKMTSNTTLTDIARVEEKLDKKYQKWQNQVNKIIEKCFKRKVRKKKQKTKTIQKLYRAKRMVKRKYLKSNLKTKEQLQK